MGRIPGSLKVVHLIPEDGLGGVETAAREMACRDDLACDFHLVSMVGKSFAPGRANTHALGFSNALNPLAQAAAVRAAIKLDPDVLICSLWKTIPAAVLIKMIRPRTRLVAFFHSVERVHGVDRAMHAILLRFADVIWADSESALDAAGLQGSGLPSRKISYVIDGPRETPEARPPQPHVISWSRIHHHKGMDRSIELVARLVARGVDVRFDLWGPDQGPRAKLEELARKLGVAEHLRFHGSMSRADLPSLAGQASFLLQLSRLEGMAMVVVEAMQFGLVPIVTPVGEIRRYCRDGENAVIVDVDDLDGAAERIATLLQDAGTYRRMSDAARAEWQDCTRYADDICAAALELAGDPE